MMSPNHRLALLVSYYLSKFDDLAYRGLGFSTHVAAHEHIGKMLDVKASSIKDMRNEFDPLHANRRAGWYQRPLRPSRARLLESFQNWSEGELRDIVVECIRDPQSENSLNVAELLDVDSERETRTPSRYLPARGITGRKAEEAFIAHFEEFGEPVCGELIDCRDQGCGYDFEIATPSLIYCVEEKGLHCSIGAVTFTAKEWTVAKAKGDQYFLAIVTDIATSRRISFASTLTEIDPISAH